MTQTNSDDIVKILNIAFPTGVDVREYERLSLLISLLRSQSGPAPAPRSTPLLTHHQAPDEPARPYAAGPKRPKKRRARRLFTDKDKARIVARAREIGLKRAATEADVEASTLWRWQREARERDDGAADGRLSAKEAGRLLGVTGRYIYKLIEAGKLKAERDIHSAWRIDPKDLEALRNGSAPQAL